MIITIDVGGTKTLVATFTPEGKVDDVTRIATPRDPSTFIQVIGEIVALLKPRATDILVIATPATVDAERGIVLYSPNLGWEKFALKALLTQKIGCSVYLENDAHLAALGATRLLGSTPNMALYITIGTGIGSGIILHGKLDSAFSRSEAGHMLFETPNGLESWESFASGRSISSKYNRLAADITDDKSWDEIVHNLATGLRVLIPALQPDVILIGGGVGVYFDRFGERLQQKLQKELPTFIPVPPILQAKHTDQIVLYGCYYYALDIPMHTS